MGGTTTHGRRASSGGTVIFVRLFIAALCLAVVAAGASWWLVRNWAPSREDYPVQGAAVDAAAGEIDWPVLRTSGADFAYIGATEGSDARDQEFARNWAGARAAGLRYGAIHRFSLCRSPGDQARLFIASVPRDNAALPPVVSLDFKEDCTDRPSRDRVLSELNTFLNEVETHSGKPAVLRISREFEEAYGLSSGINRTVWLTADALAPDYAAHRWVMWTANRWRRVRGVEGPVHWTVVRP